MTGPSTGGGVRRLGVAVEVPEPHASALARVRRDAGDRLADEMPPHITLVPPVEVRVSHDDVVGLLSAGAELVAPFEVRLRGTGTFRPVSEVVFVAVASGISSLEQLAQALQVGPLASRRRFPYHPHVTIAQDVPAEMLDEVFEAWSGFEARFVVEAFRLYEYDSARRRWDVLGDHPLRG